MKLSTKTNWNLYRCFIATYEAGGYSQAVKHIDVARNNIKANVDTLCRQLGVTLFISNSKGVTPTNHAIAIYPFIKKALVDIFKVEESLKDFDQNSIGIIRIGCQEYIAKIIIDSLIQFNLKYPNIKLKINNLPKSNNYDLLHDHDIDVWIGAMPFLNQNEFETLELKTLNNSFFATTEFINKHKIDNCLNKQNIETLPFITRFTQFDPEAQMLNRLKNIDLNIIHETASMDMVFAMIKKDIGIGYAPELFIDSFKDKNIIKLKVENAEFPKTILGCAYYKGESNKSVLAFIDSLKNSLSV